jgi:hemerythrin-like domain-containing protein
MKPIVVLMSEHRLIERMLGIVRQRTSAAGQEMRIDPGFVDTAVDFLRMYADKTHHAKEESILFRDMAKRKLPDREAEVLQHLLQEHTEARKNVTELINANEEYRKNAEPGSLGIILDKLQFLPDFYQHHINTEDHDFFPFCQHSLNSEEQEAMLQEFWESDRKMIHEKYRIAVESLEGEKG